WVLEPRRHQSCKSPFCPFAARVAGRPPPARGATLLEPPGAFAASALSVSAPFPLAWDADHHASARVPCPIPICSLSRRAPPISSRSPRCCFLSAPPPSIPTTPPSSTVGSA